jgi:hypothetical protein
MILRALTLVVFSCVVVLSSQSLFAKPDTPDICCSDGFACGGLRCCDAAAIGKEACSEDQTGYCQALCVPPGGGGGGSTAGVER